MAQRRRADSRIARLAKSVSARGILALALAALLLALSGCGGDDSEEEAGGSSSAAAADEVAAGGGKTQGAEGGQSAGEPSSSPGTGSPGSTSTPGSGSTSSGGGQPTKVPTPKGAPEPGVTPEQRQEATVASIELSSPALQPGRTTTAILSATYTCDGRDSWPEIAWKGVPEGTQELALFAMSMKPVEGKIFFNWTVAGLDPELTGIEAGSLPRGAVMGRNGFGDVGYSICPPTSESETYLFTLYALSTQLSPEKGFNPHELRKQALQFSSDGGLMAASYGR